MHATRKTARTRRSRPADRWPAWTDDIRLTIPPGVDPDLDAGRATSPADATPRPHHAHHAHHEAVEVES
jgi:hypothetical protein